LRLYCRSWSTIYDGRCSDSESSSSFGSHTGVPPRRASNQ
jgi:hypothetical protein